METIIYPQTIDYKWIYQRPQQLMREFARQGYRTIFCNHAYYIPQLEKLKEVEKNFFLCNGTIPSSLIDNQRPILWVSYPPHVSQLGRYNEKMVIFDSIDEASEEFRHWAKDVSQLRSKADIVFTTAKKLYNEHFPHHPHVYLCPNGADYEHFSKAANNYIPLPPEMLKIKKPIIGYFGAIAPWIDWKLVAYLADANPEFSFVFIGPVYSRNTHTIKRKNIFYLGRRDYEQLPAYLQTFSAGIIPFRNTSMLDACNPIKMYEYLSAGKPVITTNMPEAKSIEEVIVAETTEQFNLLLRAAVTDDTPDARIRRQKAAQKHTWAKRVAYAKEIIEKVIAERQGHSC